MPSLTQDPRFGSQADQQTDKESNPHGYNSIGTKYVDYGLGANPNPAREGLFRKEEFHYDAQNDVYIDEEVLDRMETRLKANPEILRQRREIVEHPFGSIKQWMNQGAFLMRGLEKVRAEFSLTALAYNMTRVL